MINLPLLCIEGNNKTYFAFGNCKEKFALLQCLQGAEEFHRQIIRFSIIILHNVQGSSMCCSGLIHS